MSGDSNSFVEKITKLNNTLTSQVPMESPGLMMNQVINFFKCGMFFFCFSMMLIKNNFSLPALLITLLHGSYGLIWLTKDLVFGDKSFRVRISYWGVVAVALALVCYASMSFTIINNPEYRFISVDRMLLAGYLYIFGVTLMLVADAQKTFTLMVKKGLISNGVFAWTRNPNYLGEIMLYLAFGVVAQSWFSYGYLMYVWLTLFNSNMYKKDLSLKKKEGWKEYSMRSYKLMPKLFASHAVNHVFYGVCGLLFGLMYSRGGLLNRFILANGGNPMVGW